MKAALALALLGLSLAAAQTRWQPQLADRYNYQLGELFVVPTHFIPGVKVYALDGWDTPASTVSWLVSQGAYPVCYFSAGSFENWRPDASQFLASDKGAAMDGWPGEWWLDVRSSNVRKIMQQRIAMCKSKGFVAVDPDNVDGYTNANGVGLTAADQLSYNTFLANEAHAQGMAIGLKNDLDQLTQLTPYFDFFVNEQCNQYSECGMYAPSKAAGKPVWNIEYTSTNFNKGCPQQATMGMRTTLKSMSLTASPFTECSTNPWPYSSTSPSPSASPSPSPSPRLSPSPSPSPVPSPSPSPSAVPLPSPSPSPIATSSWWRPKASDNLGWQYMTSAEFKPATMWVATASVYVIDLFLNSATTTAGIAANGGYAVCHFNAGTYENWQPDSGLFTAADHPASVWLDIRSSNVRSIMQKRLELCKSKGFVAAVPEGLDGYANANGMGLTAADQLSYNTFLANAAHSLGLSVGLMNDLDQISQLLPSFDFFVNEECMKYSECGLYKPAKLANLPVWQVEYGSSSTGTTFFQTVCKCQSTWGVKSIYKYTSINNFRLECAAKYLSMACPYSARRLLSN